MATWKKVLVSGSAIEVSQLSVGANQQIGTTQATTFLSGSFTGSFSGSFSGNGQGLTGVTATATFPNTQLTPLLSTSQVFVNDGSNKYATVGQFTASAYAGVSGDITISAAGVASIAANSVALGTDTTGDYVASITSGNGLTGGASGEGSTPTLAVGAGTHITVNADDVAVNTTTLTPAISGSIFTQVSGDISITAGGVAAIGTGVIVNADVNAAAAIAASKISFTGTSFVSASTLAAGSGQGSTTLTTNGVSSGDITATGLGTAGTPTFAGLTITNGNIAINNGTSTALTTTGTTAAVFNTTATTVNAFGAATTLNLGAATGTTTVGNSLVVTGDLFVNGTTTQVNTTDLLVEDKFILLASGSATAGDAGIVVDRGSDAAGNIAYGFDSTTDRWGYQSGIVDTTNALDPTSASGVSGSFAVYSFTEAAHGATKPITGEFAVVGSQYLDNAGNFWVYTV